MKKILVAALIVLLFVSCQTTEESPTLSVSGSATVEMKPDSVSFTLSASQTADRADDAVAALEKAIGDATKILKEEFGVDEDDISTSYFSVSPDYTYKDGERILNGQKAEESLTVLLRDLDKAWAVVSKLSSIDGIVISNVSADKADKTIESMKVRELAVQDAITKANVYANASGHELGSLLSISNTAAVPSYRNEMAVYAMASSDSSAFSFPTVSVSDAVTLVFSLVE